MCSPSAGASSPLSVSPLIYIRIRTILNRLCTQGNMAKQFTQDLLLDPKTREVEDIKHIVHAVASSSSVDKAKEFIKDVIGGRPSSPRLIKYTNKLEFLQRGQKQSRTGALKSSCAILRLMLSTSRVQRARTIRMRLCVWRRRSLFYARCAFTLR